jgi:hypothetical protein
VLLAIGGKKKIVRLLRGRMRLSWHYTCRLADVEATHRELGPQALAYQNSELKYAALPPPEGKQQPAALLAGARILLMWWPPAHCIPCLSKTGLLCSCALSRCRG